MAVHLATIGPTGHIPWAPGTAGSAVGVGLAALIEWFCPRRGGFVEVAACVAVAIFFAGIWAAGRAERAYGTCDPGAVVIDEVVGQLVVFLLRPPSSWLGYLAGFLIFRALDVIKPVPARRAERLPAGWGIMTDDLVAGAYGAVALYLLGFLIR